MKSTEHRPPRVAMVAYTEYLWDPRVKGEAETLAQAGFDVTVIAVRPTGDQSPANVNGVHLHEVPLTTKRGGRLRYLYQYGMFWVLCLALLLRLHLRHQYDLVYVHSLPDFQVFVTTPLRLGGVRVLLDLHEAMPEILAARLHLTPGSPLVRIACALEVLSCRFATHVITANDGIRAVIAARGTPESKITTIYNSGDIPTGLPEREVRGHLGLPSGPLLVHAGGINPERDLETLLRALCEVVRVVDINLAIVGDGEAGYVSDLKELTSQLGLATRVQFVGRQPRETAVAVMSQSELGLVTLKSNPLTQLAWPTRVVEFANLGKALVVPDLKFLRLTLATQAAYYAPEDPRSLAKALLSLLTDPEKLKAASVKSRQVIGRFDSSRSRAALVLLCRNLSDRTRAL